MTQLKIEKGCGLSKDRNISVPAGWNIWWNIFTSYKELCIGHVLLLVRCSSRKAALIFAPWQEELPGAVPMHRNHQQHRAAQSAPGNLSFYAPLELIRKTLAEVSWKSSCSSLGSIWVAVKRKTEKKIVLIVDTTNHSERGMVLWKGEWRFLLAAEI